MFLRAIHLTAILCNLAYCINLVVEARVETMDNKNKQGGGAAAPPGDKGTWKEFELYAEFYKFFLDFGLKANVFFYGITGAILTILYNPSGSPTGPALSPAQRLPPPVLKVLVLTPFLISLVLAAAFLVGALFWRQIAKDMKKVLDDVVPKPQIEPRLHYLTGLLLAFGSIFVFVSCYLFTIMRELKISFP